MSRRSKHWTCLIALRELQNLHIFIKNINEDKTGVGFVSFNTSFKSMREDFKAKAS